MASTSAVLNKALRELVAPLLRQAGFQHVDARRAWCWRADSISIFHLRAVGNYFSSVTGWPPGSIVVSLGLFFTFAPRPPRLSEDAKGRPRPEEYQAHMRAPLECGLDQSALLAGLPNPAERRRRDIWWVDPSGACAHEVALDVSARLANRGLPWLQEVSNPHLALKAVEADHDSFLKFSKAAFLAKHIGDRESWERYDGLAEAEARRIGHTIDRGTWTGA